MSSEAIQLRKHLNADALRRVLRQEFDAIEDSRKMPRISLGDTLMSGFAMFSLKDPSLLHFDSRREEPNSNLSSLFEITRIPSDTQFRAILDPVDPDALAPCFATLFRQIERGNVLHEYRYFDDYLLICMDGTDTFSSKKIHCPHCQTQHHSNGSVTYSHKLLAGVFVHPDRAEVIPVMPEPILKQDGQTKNDCEINAAKRFLRRLRQDHPRLKVIVTADGLFSDAPLVRLLKELKLNFLLVAKPSDHKHLFAQMEREYGENKKQVFQRFNESTGLTEHYRWIEEAELNESNKDVRVNLLHYWETKGAEKVYENSWATMLPINKKTCNKAMRAGRARWKIENETFNTLKNQQYNCEHNYGHGKQNLSTILVLLMLLAFGVDQIQQIACELFQAVLKKLKRKKRLWEEMRNLFNSFIFTSMEELLYALLKGIDKGKAKLIDDS